jgi:hypothetical protein
LIDFEISFFRVGEGYTWRSRKLLDLGSTKKVIAAE